MVCRADCGLRTIYVRLGIPLASCFVSSLDRMTNEASLLWRSTERDVISWREWDGQCVVRNSRTGNTHLLSPFASQILLTLVSSDSGVASPRLAGELSSSILHDANRVAAVEQVLTEFQRVGLVHPERL